MRALQRLVWTCSANLDGTELPEWVDRAFAKVYSTYFLRVVMKSGLTSEGERILPIPFIKPLIRRQKVGL